ncbi:hypothetical protein MLD38_006474 [Melastoma candidum]|uniref:Uncharacterized protein n=1 Tax=Melastoma candidum TaxID=119954 RepID=A0ACB9RMN1_9MYRT|nr:hypothetical protein MLD38_006474 [Melastoma candidum]
MASHKNYRFFYVDAGVYPAATRHDHPALELEESNIYDRPRKVAAKRIEDPHREQIRRKTTSPLSLQVNIPDWSKILQGEEYGRRGGGEEDYLDNEGGHDCISPHVFLAGTRIGCSFSVHEGVERTLNGRDLSRVRNAIWAKTVFQN